MADPILLPVTRHAEVRDLPSYSFTDWDSVQLVKAAMRSLETGVMNDAAQVVDAMRRDDRIDGCLQTRSTAIPSLPFTLEPGIGRSAKKVADEAEEKFECMVSDTTASEFLAWRLMLGVAFGELIWDAKVDTARGSIRWEPYLKVWHPKFFYWRWDTRSWWVTTMDGNVEIEPGNGQWVVFGYGSESRPWMHGKVRALYVPWLLRQWAQRDAGRYSEVYGNPFRVGYTPLSADKEDKDRFIKELAKVGTESVIRLPQAIDGQAGFDVKLVEATGKGFEGFIQLVKEQSTNIAISLLGQNLSTEVKGASLAAARVHENVRGDLLQADADALSQCLREQVLGPWASYNFGSPELAPTPCWKTEPEEDKKSTGDAFKSVGDGLVSLRASGAKPDVDTILERLGIPVTAPSEEPPPPQPTLPPGAPMPKKTEKLDRTASITKPAIEGQLYVDAVVGSGVLEASQPMRAELNKLMDAVEGAKSFDELKDRLVTAYGAMDTEAFADVLQKALVLAQLNGIHAVMEEA